MHLRFRPAAAAGALLLAASLSACSADSGDGKDADQSAEPAVSHVHGLGIDPADGRLYVATHEGVVVVSKSGKAETVSDKADYMGFTVVGPKTFLGSGHPAPGSDEPANRGLLESKDSGKSWKTRSLGGEVDFHALKFAHGTIYGFDSTNGMVRISKNGSDWKDGARLAALDLGVDPKKPEVVLATTEGGVAKSTDGGKKFGNGKGPVLAFLSWPEAKALYGVSPSGELQRSSDGGVKWESVGTVPGGQPQALTAVDADHILAATQNGVYESRNGGKSFTKRLPIASEGSH